MEWWSIGVMECWVSGTRAMETMAALTSILSERERR
jgi:hypothetical protein